MNKNLFGWVLFIALAVMMFMLLNKGQTQYAAITIDEFESRLKNDRVRMVTVETDKLLGEFTNDETIGDRGERIKKFYVPLPANAAADWDLMRWLLDNRRNATIRVENNPNWLLQVMIPLIPWLLIFGFLWFFVFRKMRSAQTAEIKPWPVYIVAPPNTSPGQAPPPQPMPVTPITPAPGGDN